jgi:hypothetical protein
LYTNYLAKAEENVDNSELVKPALINLAISKVTGLKELNFVDSLDAMFVAEEWLRGRSMKGWFQAANSTSYSDVWSAYRAKLNNVLGGNWTNVHECDIFHATAPQRAEAFVRIVGLWKESKRKRK